MVCVAYSVILEIQEYPVPFNGDDITENNGYYV